jgi:hypothetical protein
MTSEMSMASIGVFEVGKKFRWRKTAVRKGASEARPRFKFELTPERINTKFCKSSSGIH